MKPHHRNRVVLWVSLSLLAIVVGLVKAGAGPFNYNIYLPSGVENYSFIGWTQDPGPTWGLPFIYTGTESYFISGPASSYPYGTADFQSIKHILRVWPESAPSKCPENAPMFARNYSCFGSDSGLCRTTFGIERTINALTPIFDYFTVSKHRLIDTRAVNTYTNAAPKPFFSRGDTNSQTTGRHFNGYAPGCDATIPLPPSQGDECVGDECDD